MVHDAQLQQSSLLKKNEAHGPVFKIHNDPRFFGVGKFLSHIGLDELPQLLNIMKGDMVFFGPRPLPVEEAIKLTPTQRKREFVYPGIISPWIFSGYHKSKFSDWMESDLQYVREKSVFVDFVLFLKTLRLVGVLFWKELRG